MSFDITIQYAIKDKQDIPSELQLQQWVTHVLQSRLTTAQCCIRIVEPDEIQQLNKQFRNKDKATNVLAFPVDDELAEVIPERLLGDIVICAEVVKDEALTQNKPLTAHWAHMVIHGLLHLLGYDHVTESQAQEMEPLEIHTLAELGFADPYEVNEHDQ